MGIAVRDESSGRPSARAMDGSAESPVFDSEHHATSTSFRWRSVGDLFWLRFFVLTGNATTHVARVLFERVHVRRSPDRMVLVFPMKKTVERSVSFGSRIVENVREKCFVQKGFVARHALERCRVLFGKHGSFRRPTFLPSGER